MRQRWVEQRTVAGAGAVGSLKPENLSRAPGCRIVERRVMGLSGRRRRNCLYNSWGQSCGVHDWTTVGVKR